MKVLITGCSGGIGLAMTRIFLERGHAVAGLDMAVIAKEVLVKLTETGKFEFFLCDVSKSETLPDIEGINIVVNNAGVSDENNAIAVNLIGYINVGEKYAFLPNINSILNINSIAAHTGIEFPYYSASQGGRHAYTKNLTLRLAKKGITVNSISPGGVLTDWNKNIIENATLYKEVLGETLLGKWASPKEIAELAYFLTVTNKSITGQDIIIDNGETARYNFVCKDEERSKLNAPVSLDTKKN